MGRGLECMVRSYLPNFFLFKSLLDSCFMIQRYNIGFTTTQLKDIFPQTTTSTNKNSEINSIYIPSQAFLTSLIQIFPYLFIHIKSKFNERFLFQ
jgi:hypothetical protein